MRVELMIERCAVGSAIVLSSWFRLAMWSTSMVACDVRNLKPPRSRPGRARAIESVTLPPVDGRHDFQHVEHPQHRAGMHPLGTVVVEGDHCLDGSAGRIRLSARDIASHRPDVPSTQVSCSFSSSMRLYS